MLKYFVAPQGFDSPIVEVDGVEYQIVDRQVAVPEDCGWHALMDIGFLPVA